MSKPTLCDYIAGQGSEANLSSSCAWHDLSSGDPWMVYISQLGFSSAHLSLAIASIILTTITTFRTLRQYRRFTKATGFDEHQLLNISIYIGIGLLGTLYIAALSFFHSADFSNWFIFSHLCEVVTYALQILFCVTAWRTILHPTKLQCTSLTGLIAAFFVVPATVYLSVVCSYGYSAGQTHAQHSTAARNAARAMFVLLQTLKVVFAIATIGATIKNVLTRKPKMETFMLVGSVTLSVLTTAVSIIAVMFTFGIICPDAEERGVSLLIYDWYYFSQFVLFGALCVFRGQAIDFINLLDLINRREPSLHPQEQGSGYTTREPSNRQTSPLGEFRHPSRPAWQTTPPLPRRTGSLSNNLPFRNGTRVLSLPLPVTAPLSAQFLPREACIPENDYRERLRAFTQVSWEDVFVILAMFLVGLCIDLILWINIVLGEDVKFGIATLQIVVFSLCVAVQLTCNVFGPAPSCYQLLQPDFTIWLKNGKKRIFLTTVIVLGAAIPFLILPNMRYLYSSSLWSAGTLLCLSTTGRTVSKDGLGRLLQSFGAIFGDIKKVHAESAVTKSGTPAHTTKRKIAIRQGLIVLVSMLCVPTWIISLLYDLNFALAASCIIWFATEILGVAARVGGGVRSQATFWLVGLSSLAVFVATFAIAPAYASDRSVNDLKIYSTDGSDNDARFGLYLHAKDFKDLAAVDAISNKAKPMVLDVGSTLLSAGPFHDLFCVGAATVDVTLVAASLDTLNILSRLELPPSIRGFGFRKAVTSTVVADFTITSFSVVSLQSILLNPMTVQAEHHRNRTVMIAFELDDEVGSNFKYAQVVGADAVIVQNAARASQHVNSSSRHIPPITLPNFPEIGSVIRNMFTDEARWIFALLGLPVLLLVGGALYIALKIATLRDYISHKALFSLSVLDKIVTLDKATCRFLAGAAEVFSVIGWCIFGIGGMQADPSSWTKTAPGFTYVFAVLGFSSCILGVITIFKRNIALLTAFNIFVQCTCMATAGHVFHLSILKGGYGWRFMLIGAAIFSIGKVVRFTVALQKIRFQRQEVDRACIICACYSLAGWLCIVVAMGRTNIDGGSNVAGVGYYGTVITSPISALLCIVAANQSFQPLNAGAGGLLVLTIFFLGGILGDLAMWSNLATASFVAILVGSVLHICGTVPILLLRSLEVQSDRSKALRRQLKAQLRMTSSSTDRQAPHLPAPCPPSFFKYITQNSSTWFAWRLLSIVYFVGWIVSTSGLGIATGELITGQRLTAGLAYTVSALPTMVFLILALLRDSKRIAALASLLVTFNWATIGAWINFAAFSVHEGREDRTATNCVLLGGFLSFGALVIQVAIVARRLVLTPQSNPSDLGKRMYLAKLTFLTFLIATGWSTVVGGASQAINVEDFNKRLPAIFAILAAILMILTKAGFWTAVTQTRKALDSQALTVRKEYTNQLSVVLIIAQILLACATAQLGAVFFATVDRSSLDTDSSIAHSLLLTGSILSLMGYSYWNIFALFSSQPWQHETHEEARTRWTGTHANGSSQQTILFDNDSLSSESIRQTEKGPIADKRKTVVQKYQDLHTIVGAWPALQVLLKVLICTMAIGWAIFVSGFRRYNGQAGNIVDYGFSIIGWTPVLTLMAWISKGKDIFLICATVGHLAGLAFSSCITFRSFTSPHPSASTTALSGCLAFNAASIVVLTLLLSARKHQVHFQGTHLKLRYLHMILISATISFVIFIIGFWTLCNNLSAIPADTGETAASFLLIFSGICHAILYISHLRNDRRRIRVGLYLTFCMSFGAASGTLFFHIQFSSEANRSRGASVACIIGTLGILLSQLMLVTYRTRVKTAIDLTFEEKESLPCINAPRNFEEAIHWIHGMFQDNSKYLLKICIFLTGVGFFSLVAGLGSWEVPGELDVPRGVFDTFALSSVFALTFLLIKVYLRWRSVGLIGTLNMYIALFFGGAACFGAYFCPRSSGNAAALAGSILLLIGLGLFYVVLLHRGEVHIPRKGIFTLLTRFICTLVLVGSLTFGAGFALAKGRLAGADNGSLLGYLLAVLCGALFFITSGLESLNLRGFPNFSMDFTRIRRRFWKTVYAVEDRAARFRHHLVMSLEPRAERREAAEVNMRKMQLSRWTSAEDLAARQRQAIGEAHETSQENERMSAAPPPISPDFIPYPVSRRLNVFLATLGVTLCGAAICASYPGNKKALTLAQRLQVAGSFLIVFGFTAYLALIEYINLRESDFVEKGTEDLQSSDQGGSTPQIPSPSSTGSSEDLSSSSSSNLSLFLTKRSQSALNIGSSIGSRPFLTSRAASSSNLTTSRFLSGSDYNIRSRLAMQRPPLRQRRTLSSSNLLSARLSSTDSPPVSLNQATILEADVEFGSQENARQLLTNRQAYGSDTNLASAHPPLKIKTSRAGGHRRAFSDSVATVLTPRSESAAVTFIKRMQDRAIPMVKQEPELRYKDTPQTAAFDDEASETMTSTGSIIVYQSDKESDTNSEDGPPTREKERYSSRDRNDALMNEKQLRSSQRVEHHASPSSGWHSVSHTPTPLRRQWVKSSVGLEARDQISAEDLDE
ncbi:hypothetical protein DFS34DRAFT_188435 [Phlyctochytrium arcticum]|nr:hypothetical protein DFS34DRAFT_188435 [Phlyctochytrium arcticum]